MSSRFTQIPDYYTIEPESDDPIQPGGLNIPRKVDVYFIDVNVDYKQNLKGLIVYDEDVVKMQIANIMATPLGSDHFEPTYGSNVPYRLMDPINAITGRLLYNDTIGALHTWMELTGRIRIDRTNSDIIPIDNNPDNEGYQVTMYYTVLKTSVIASFRAFLLR